MISGDSSETFDPQFQDLFEEVEKWGLEERRFRKKSNEGGISLNKKAGYFSAAFFIIAQAILFVLPRFHNSYVAMGSAITALICVGASFFLLIARTFNMTQAAYWKDLVSTFDHSNYPFGVLRHSVARDLRNVERFNRFPDRLLKLGFERIQEEEKELKERLSVISGNPSLGLVATVAFGALTTWLNFHERLGIWMPALTVAWLLALALTVTVLQLRVQLLELSGCRLLLTLVIARRN